MVRAFRKKPVIIQAVQYDLALKLKRVNHMTEETKEKLRKDLIDAHELLESGYAGVNKSGKIVDRRIDKDAVPIQRSSVFPGTPQPKKV